MPRKPKVVLKSNDVISYDVAREFAESVRGGAVSSAMVKTVQKNLNTLALRNCIGFGTNKYISDNLIFNIHNGVVSSIMTREQAISKEYNEKHV